MKKSELRKLIREVISEQTNPMCYYCLTEAIDTGITMGWDGSPLDPVIGPGIVQGISNMDVLQSTNAFGPNNCITNDYGYEIGSNGGPMFGTFNPAIIDSCNNTGTSTTGTIGKPDALKDPGNLYTNYANKPKKAVAPASKGKRNAPPRKTPPRRR